MTTTELIKQLQELPENTELDLIVADQDDNWEAVSLHISDLFANTTTVELTLQLDPAYNIEQGF